LALSDDRRVERKDDKGKRTVVGKKLARE